MRPSSDGGFLRSPRRPPGSDPPRPSPISLTTGSGSMATHTHPISPDPLRGLLVQTHPDSPLPPVGSVSAGESGSRHPPPQTSRLTTAIGSRPVQKHTGSCRNQGQGFLAPAREGPAPHPKLMILLSRLLSFCPHLYHCRQIFFWSDWPSLCVLLV